MLISRVSGLIQHVLSATGHFKVETLSTLGASV